MIRRGWVDAKDIRDPKVATELMRFFGAKRIDDIEILPHAAKRPPSILRLRLRNWHGSIGLSKN
jgi:hypothetical protein